MGTRELIRIDEDLCDGCGQCVVACAEGAIEIVDGKARLISETYCDGLGACIGHCPQGALTIVEEEAAPFEEEAVWRHLAARERRAERATGGKAPWSLQVHGSPSQDGGCPGSRAVSFAAEVGDEEPEDGNEEAGKGSSRLRHWPVQLHLVAPTAPFFRNADVLLAADCVAYAMGDFHRTFLGGRALAIACPKLDSHQEVYLDKLVGMIDEAMVRSLTVMIMEVPCCGGLLQLVRTAAARARRQVEVTCIVVGVRGDVLQRQVVCAGQGQGQGRASDGGARNGAAVAG